MSDNKHGRSFGIKGYYIALVLCAAAIGIMSYVYYAGQETAAVQTANVPDTLVGTVTLPTGGTTPTAPAPRPPSPRRGSCRSAPRWRVRC